MSIALYRKYRPTKLKEVLGQDHIVTSLEGALKEGEIGHAYLFVGSRGTGKTSIARIIASELKTAEVDVYEIDAASNTGVDNIRDLSDNVHTLPFESDYKVYIIDEVHMLSKAAFNAFLKTLEEPPLHVIFILATTELDKVPETIVSRCQVFNFKKPGRAILSKMIKDIAKKEGYELESSSAETIALLADGSYRDAQSILQKVISASADKKISLEEVESITGSPPRSLVLDLIEGIVAKNSSKALASVTSASKAGIDMKLFLTMVLDLLRAVLLIQNSTQLDLEIQERYGDDYEKLKELSKKGISTDILAKFLLANREIKFAAIPELPIEIAILDALAE